MRYKKVNTWEEFFVKKAVVIGISGGSGSGKTTLAKKLKEHF